MAVGDFERLIRPKITNPKCESCGQTNWDVVEDAAGEEPFLACRTPGGSLGTPPNGIRTLITVCKNCFYYRTYVIPGGGGVAS